MDWIQHASGDRNCQHRLRHKGFSYVNFDILHSTLRELRENITSVQTIIGLLSAIAICTISGPFGTIDIFSPLPRLEYWTFMIVPNYSIGLGINLAVVRQGRGNLNARSMMAAAIAGIVIAAYVSAINITVIDQYPRDFPSRAAQFAIAVCVAAVVSVTVAIFIRYNAKSNDAFIETPTQGIQIHRSHWVATDHVEDYKNPNDVWHVVTSNGQEVPISRGNRQMVIAAGLVPARG